MKTQSMRRIPIAWLMLTHRKGRLLLSILGIAFAVLLMFTQLGFLTSLFDSQTLLIRHLDADIVLACKSRNNLHLEEAFPLARIYQARDVEGVASTTSILLENAFVRSSLDGRSQIVRLIGIEPDDPGLILNVGKELLPTLKRGDAVLFDESSRGFFGTFAAGDVIEVSGRQMRVAGLVDLGADFKNDGTIIASREACTKLLPYPVSDTAALGLVRVKPGYDAIDVARHIQTQMPSDIIARTRDELDRMERSFWSKMTPTGFIFTLGLIVGFVIGVMICYQILYNEINDHLPQFATLKAVGFSDRFLVGIVLTEAVLLALLGLVPAIFASQFTYASLEAISGIYMEMTFPRVLLVSGLTLLMCVVSAVLAVTRVMKADPAEMFS